MILLDTHAWIWWAARSPKLSAKAAKAIGQAKKLGVAAISCWEVAMLVDRQRLELDRPVEEWLAGALSLERVELLPLSWEIALESTRLGRHFHGDPADRLIVATALCHRAPLVTRDARIAGYDGVETLW